MLSGIEGQFKDGRRPSGRAVVQSRMGNGSLAHCFAWLFCGALTTAVVWLGALFGVTCVEYSRPSSGLISTLAGVNGEDYASIVETGYSYNVNEPSSVAFFPAFPILAKGLSSATGMTTVASLLIVSNTCCLLAFPLMGVYLRRRRVSRGATLACDSNSLERAGEELLTTYSLLTMGLLPTTFFFRMAHSESLFLCLTIAAMYAMAQAWRIPVVALLVGFGTAIRPVGVALLLPMAWYIWRTSASNRQFAARLVYAVPLGCWGLLAYVTYQYCAFGQPLAFALTQGNWRMRPDAGFGDKFWSLVSWEPIWSVYVPGMRNYWNRTGTTNLVFDLQFGNPIYFVGTAALIALGAWRRWLTSFEVLVSVPLLLIPYVTRAYEWNMQSQGRYAAVVFPVYIVLGNLLARLPTVVSVALLALSGFLMAAYSELFVHPIL